MSNEEGDRIDGEEELAPPDWRVRAGHRNSMSEESVSCIAVKEDRHQNIMSSDALKNGVEEPWTIERVAQFIDLLCDREITRKKRQNQPSLRSEIE